jgi:hypothetical protein
MKEWGSGSGIFSYERRANRIPIIAMIVERSGKAKKESRVEGPVWSFDAHCASRTGGGANWRAHMWLRAEGATLILRVGPEIILEPGA